MKISTQVKTKWMQFKVSALSASMTALIVSSIPHQVSASDIDIYQAGGTGAINIYFMLDASSSMWSSSIKNDYQATSSKKFETAGYYTKNNNGNKWLSMTEVAWGSGNYIKVGSDFAKFSGGNWKIEEFPNKQNGMSNNNNRFDYLSTKKINYSVCQTSSDLSFAFKHSYTVNNEKDEDHGKSYDFTYADVGNPFCMVNVSNTYWDITNVSDQNYINKVKTICENYPEDSDTYYCLSRLANLKKGVMQVVLDEAINEEHNFAVGQYPKQSRTNGAETKIDFTNLGTFANKVAFINAVESISNKSSTPISYGYTEAVSKLQAHTTNVTNTKASCSGNGVYLLTDGEPNDTSSISGPINSKSEVTTSYWANEALSYWKKMAQYAIDLREDKKLRIKTATVGLGSGFYTTDDYARDGAYECSAISGSGNAGYDRHHQNLCYIGTKKKNNGMGGFYNAQSAQDIVSSIEQFVNDVSEDIQGTTMGTSTVPIDALDQTKLQNYSYFPMFQPIVGGDEQLWAGNLKKFAIKTDTGTVVDQLGKAVFKDGTIQEKLSDYWYESAGSSDKDVFMAWGGLLSKLKVHHKPLVTSGTLGFNRNVYLDFGVNSGDDLKHAVRDILNGSVTLDNKQYLYGLLGYSKLTQSDFDALASKSYNDQVNYLQTKITNQDFQMGSVIHSTPIMLTQKGIFEEKDGEYGISEREDYILAGTTQGLVQVVNAENGKEVFSFLPSEFLTRSNNSQEKGFAESLAMNRYPASESADIDNFFYGVDGPWVAHTEYEYSFEGDKEIMTAKKQYAYGGLRMGGRSYYALDLTNLGKTSGKPKLLFAIKPDDHTTEALSYMGESWSKPVITYIPWKGQKKLAMIVGGGYDRKYEQQLSNADLSGKVDGNGIYIFAAEDLDTNTKAGTLLWWGSSNATSKGGAIESTEIKAMTHSIPSRVKAVDRNGDGITDHLYVGDLGGQVFRIDFNSKLGSSAASSNLVYQANKIADLNTPGKSPRRFYEAPTFTIHKDDTTGKRFAMVTLASGDRSSPLMTSTDYPQDYVVAIKDDTITTSPVGAPSLINSTMMHDISGEGSFNKATHKGWYYAMPKSDGKQIRGIEEGIALDNDLYYSFFNPDASTATEEDVNDCTGGVTGKSIVYKFCLPYGDKTCFGTTTSSNPENIGELGAGIIGLTLGAGRSKETHRTLIFNKDVDPKPTEYAVTDKLVPKRWFEYLPFNSGGS